MNVLTALAGALLRRSIETSAVVGLVLLAQTAFRSRLSAGWRHALWFLVLAKLLLPTSIQTPWSLFNVKPWRPLSTARLETGSFPVATNTALGAAVAGHPTTRFESNHPISAATPAVQMPAVPFFRGSESGTSAGSASLFPPAKPPSSFRLGAALSWIWLILAAALTARLAVAYLHFAGKLRRLTPIESGPVLEAFRDCARTTGLDPKVTLLETDAVETPALFGFLEARLLFPPKFAARFRPAEIRHVILHELAHLERRDLWVNGLINLLQAAHWFNPVIWLAFARMKADRELACDAWALLVGGQNEKETYGRTVIKLLETANRPAPITGALGILENKSQIKERIRWIARFEHKARSKMLALALFAGLGLVTLTDGQTEKSGPPAQPRPPEPALHSESNQPGPTSPEPSAQFKKRIATLVQDGRLLMEMGKLDEAEEKLRQVTRQDPENKRALNYLELIRDQRLRQQAITARRKIFEKLRAIVLDEVRSEGLPLSTVIRDLDEQARQRDPAGHGVHFIIFDDLSPQPAGDRPPATAQAPRNRTAEAVITLSPALHHITLAVALNAITKSSSIPIGYSVEDYGVVFRRTTTEFSRSPTEPPILYTRTFKVDPNTFIQALHRVIQPPSLGGGDLGGGAIPFATATNLTSVNGDLVRDLFIAGGVDFSTNSFVLDASGNVVPSGKAIFFNDRTGIIFARATLEDLDLMEKILQVLNVSPPQVMLEAQLEGVAGQRVTTLSARKVAIHFTDGSRLEITPSVRPDGESILLEVDYARPGRGSDERFELKTSSMVRDGRKLVLSANPSGGPGESDSSKRIVLFITPTIVDPAGNPIHPNSRGRTE